MVIIMRKDVRGVPVANAFCDHFVGSVLGEHLHSREEALGNKDAPPTGEESAKGRDQGLVLEG